eukprot:3485968-Amphidinium_carterae.1
MIVVSTLFDVLWAAPGHLLNCARPQQSKRRCAANYSTTATKASATTTATTTTATTATTTGAHNHNFSRDCIASPSGPLPGERPTAPPDKNIELHSEMSDGIVNARVHKHNSIFQRTITSSLESHNPFCEASTHKH